MFTRATITLSALMLFGIATNAIASDRQILPQFTHEDAENKIADRYPSLEQSYPVTNTVTGRQAMALRHDTLPQFTHEDAENKIADRYPSLEQTYAVSGNAVGRQFGVPQHAALPQFTHEDAEDKIADRYPMLEQPYPIVDAGSHVVRRRMPTPVAERAPSTRKSARAG